MKNLAKILLLTGVLLSPLAVSKAQEKSERSESSISLFVSSYSPQSNSLSERYGRSLSYGVGFGSEIAPNLSIGGTVSYLSDEAEVPKNLQGFSAKTKMSMLDISPRVDYLIPFKAGYFYIGGDFSLLNFNEGGSLYYDNPWPGHYENKDVTATNIGGGVHAGIDFDLDPNSDAQRIFVEVCIKTGAEKSGGSYLIVGVRGSL